MKKDILRLLLCLLIVLAGVLLFVQQQVIMGYIFMAAGLGLEVSLIICMIRKYKIVPRN